MSKIFEVKGFKHKSPDELISLSSSLWLPTINTSKLYNVNTDSWFSMSKTLKSFDIIEEKEFIDNELIITKDKPIKITKLWKDPPTLICDFNYNSSPCDNYAVENHSKCIFHHSKCSFIVINNNKLSRTCNKLTLHDDNDFCKDHINIKQRRYASLVSRTCKFILTQGDHKHLPCGDFISDNFDYCKDHIKRVSQGDLTRNFKVRFYPSKEYKEIFSNWFGGSRKIWNSLVSNSKTDKTFNNTLNLKTLRKEYTTNPEDEFLRNTPSQIRDQTLQSYITSVKNGFESEKPFEIKFKSKKNQQCIEIDKNNIKIKNNKLYIYSRTLKDPIKFHNRSNKDKKLQKILTDGFVNHNIKLIKTITNKYYLCIPYDVHSVKNTQTSTLAIDPGEISFVTCYSNDGSTFEMNENGENRKMLINYYKGIDKLKSIKDNMRNNKHEETNKKYFKNQMKKLKHRILLKEEHITNRIRDMHYKVISQIKDYKTIYIPEFNTKQMISKKKNLTHAVRRSMQGLSHYRFRMRLITKAAETNIKVVVCDESYTSQTCGRCFNRHKVQGREYKCPNCKVELSRDMNGARNIMIKNHLI